MSDVSENIADLAGRIRPSLIRLYLAMRRHTPIPEYTAAQASALATLVDHGPLRMGELADRESIRMPTATALVDGLCKADLVERTPDPADRRAVQVALTDHGRDVLRRVGSERDVVLTRALADLSDEHRDALAAAAPALQALRDRLDKPDRASASPDHRK
nr:MarR family transcriptional regulator [Gordonia soli]